jgi:hypothetical protein
MTELALATDLSYERARILTDAMRSSAESLWEMLTRAYQGRAWLALGHSSWDEYLDRELGDVRVRLPRAERREVVASMRDAGMSTRAIAASIGVSDGTVRNDAGAQDYAPGPVTGRDGKTYNPRPVVDPAPEPEIIDAELVEDEPPTVPSGTPARDSKPRTDVPATVNAALLRAREAATLARRVTRQHLATRKNEAATWSRDLAQSIEALQRLHDDLEGVK